MTALELYKDVSDTTSNAIIKKYSTSFYLASTLFTKDIKEAIFAIYGFVRVADEIVDSFHGYNQEKLLNEFERNTFEAIEEGISPNPILNSFQRVVNTYSIDEHLIRAFLKSMRIDLTKKIYTTSDEINEYIYGSAEVVGLMSLKVFCKNDKALYEKLENSAIKLGAAFQKVNFLRDLKQDMQTLNRSYFPNISENAFNEKSKAEIISEIEADFEEAYKGIKQLPKGSRLSVLIAYFYYKRLLRKIKNTPAKRIINTRIRVSNVKKIYIIFYAYWYNKIVFNRFA